MSKRRLTHQQARRIAGRRRPKDSADSKILDHTCYGPEIEGLVICNFGNQADVEDLETGQTLRCHLRANLGDIATGDRVMWQSLSVEARDEGVINSVLRRSSELHRPDSFGKLKLVAANLNRALITIAPEPEAHTNLVDRYLVASETLGLEPIILINKLDLLNDDHPLNSLGAFYQELGYKVTRVSAKCGSGMASLTEHLKNNSCVFVGQSGVGKSSIIQALLPDEPIKIGRLSHQVKKGRHTTTHARLYHLPDGGDLIDSPGIREFGLWHLQSDQVAMGFIEFRPHLGRCKFRNCSHSNEPQCALLSALKQGEISQQRFNSYRHIVDNLDDVSMRSE